LIQYDFEIEKDNYNNNDLNRMKSWSYFFSIGLEPKNFSVIKSINERSNDFVEFVQSLLPDDAIPDRENIIKNYSNLIRSYLLKNNF
jgi:hypothetical protein